MAGSLNRVTLIGNLGKAPEIRTTQDGTKIAQFSVATSESWKDKASGERKERTEWSRIVVFNERLADIAEKYLHKGSKVYIEGQLQTRKWTDKDGAEKYTTEVVLTKFKGEIVMLDGKSDEGAKEAQPDKYPSHRPAAHGASMGSDLDDEIPFAPMRD